MTTTAEASAFISSLLSDLAAAGDHHKASEILASKFDARWISCQTLGLLLPRLSQDQIAAYTDAYRAYLPRVLRFPGDPGQAKITNASELEAQEFRVDTTGEFVVTYRVRMMKDGTWKVLDLIMQGNSIATTHRDLLGSMIKQKGIEAVVEYLKSDHPAH